MRVVTETNYTDTLRRLFLAKVARAIKKAATEHSYAERLRAEKFAFLPTRALFREHMDQAENDVGWEKKSF